MNASLLCPVCRAPLAHPHARACPHCGNRLSAPGSRNAPQDTDTLVPARSQPGDPDMPQATKVRGPRQAAPTVARGGAPQADAPTLPRQDGAPAPQARIGPYRVLKQLGRGGMGVVYQAEDVRLKRLVALKVIRSGQDARPDELERFRLEAQHAAKLKHANLVQIYDAGQDGALDYFTMDFVDGLTLGDWVARNAPGLRQRMTVLEKVARAIGYAHAHGIIHRDLKPSNVMVDAQHEPHVMDFGLARSVDTQAGLTLSGTALGTPAYMPPEQAEGRPRDMGPHSDVWSLGAVLYELLAERPPFTGRTPYMVIQAVSGADPVPPSRYEPSLPRDLETICLKCLEKPPARRYADATALANDLRAWLNGEAISARPPSRGERLLRWSRRHPALLSAVGVALLTAVGAAGYAYVQQSAKGRRIREAVARGQTRLRDANSEEDFRAAEQAFAAALALDAANREAQTGLREAYAAHARAAIAAQNWDKAAEFLERASKTGLDREQIQALQTQLDEGRRAPERAAEARVLEVLKDARRGAQRTQTAEAALQTLIGLERETTVTRLLNALGDPNVDVRMLAVRALGWMDDARVAPALQAYLERRDPDPLHTRSEALRGIIRRAPDDEALYGAVRQRVLQEPGHLNSALVRNAQPDYERYAAKWAQSAPQPGPNDDAGRYAQALQAYEGGRYADTVKMLDALLKRRPELTEALNLRGHALRSLGQFKFALADFETYIQKLPADPLGYDGRGLAKLGAKDLDGALADFAKALDLEPARVASRYHRGVALLEKSEANAARAEFDAVLAAQPEHVNARGARGMARKAAGDLAGAEDDLRQASAQAPRNLDLLINLGAVLQARNDFAGAAAAYGKVLDRDPKRAEAWYHRSLARYMQRDLPGAREDCDRALELDARYALAWGHRARIREWQGDAAGALEDYGRAAEADPSQPETFINRSMLLLARGDLDAAGADAERAVALAPERAMVWTNRATVRISRGEADGVLADCAQALERDARCWQALGLRACVLYAQGKHADFLKALDAARALHPQPALLEKTIRGQGEVLKARLQAQP